MTGLTTTTSRRAILGALAIAMPAATVAAVGHAVERQDERSGIDPNAGLIGELDSFDTWTRDLEASKTSTEEDWNRWRDQMEALYRRAEALAPTSENIPAKVRAVRSIVLDEPLTDQDAGGDTVSKLAMHIVRALMEG